MFGIGIQELVIILIIILFLFGSKKLPELARSMGQSLKELRKGMSDSGDDSKTETKKTKDKKKLS